jgi:hypothetical protein
MASMTKTEKAIRDFCGHRADWWPSASQVQAMLALAEPDPLFTVPVAARKWTALQDEGYKMQTLRFARDGKIGAIDGWGKVLWEPVQNQFNPDWDEKAVLVEEMQRMAKQLEEMKDWEAIAADQALTIAMMKCEQEPVAWVSEVAEEVELMLVKPRFQAVPLFTSPPHRQPTEERNFCPRCGKRLASGFVEISIHTCTPPRDNK